MRSAIEADANTSPETREWADLSGRFNLGELFESIVEHRASSGAIAEVQAERGIGANAIPTEMLMVEHRAVTPAPSDVGQSQSEITGFVFPQSVAAFLGIPSPIVPVGDATFPVLTSDPAAGVPAENASQSETTGTFTADVLTPGRIQASFFWSREDAARMAGMGDALRAALQAGIADKLDSEILQGTEGLLTGAKLSNHAQASASTYADYVADLLYARVDGRYAFDLADIRVVMGSDVRQRCDQAPHQRGGKRPGPHPQRFGRREGVGQRPGSRKQQAERRREARQSGRHGGSGVGFGHPDTRRNHQGRQRPDHPNGGPFARGQDSAGRRLLQARNQPQLGRPHGSHHHHRQTC